MVIEKVHGLHATGVSLNDRFTMLATAAPDRVAARARRRNPVGIRNNTNYRNQALIEQLTRRLEWQAKRKALRQRLGVGPGALRRFGSESSLPGLRRSNSFGNISQGNGPRNQGNWRGSNANLSRSASFSNLNQAAAAGRGRQMMRGFRRRGGADRALRGRFRGGVRGGRVTRATPRPNAPRRGRGAARGRGAGRGRGGQGGQGRQGAQGRGGAARGRGGAMRGRGRGGMGRQPQQVPSKEELDLQLDQYMAGSKSALDKELDAYMKNAMDME